VITIGQYTKTFYEFFAGIGLVRLGLEADGWKCLWANDVSESKLDFYERNFGKEETQLADIWHLKSSELPEAAFMATASFPCTDLSVAGYRKGLRGSESSTFFAFERLLRELDSDSRGPQVVLIENVPGLLTSHSGRDIDAVLAALDALGYSLDMILLDAARFVPQSRLRLFVVGVKHELARQVATCRSEAALLDEWASVVSGVPSVRPKSVLEVAERNAQLTWCAFELPHPPELQATLSDVLERIPDSSPLWWSSAKTSKLCNQMSERHSTILKGLMLRNTYYYGTVYRRMRKGSSMAELRTDGIAGCLRTPRGGSSKQILVRAGLGKVSARWLTPREYARLQGVPDAFHLPANTTDALFGLGDAVCVPAITWISRNILTKCHSALLREMADAGFPVTQTPVRVASQAPKM